MSFVCIAVTNIDRDSTKERCGGAAETADANRSDMPMVFGRKEDLALATGTRTHAHCHSRHSVDDDKCGGDET